jgi:hypothetical protein
MKGRYQSSATQTDLPWTPLSLKNFTWVKSADSHDLAELAGVESEFALPFEPGHRDLQYLSFEDTDKTQQVPRNVHGPRTL